MPYPFLLKSSRRSPLRAAGLPGAGRRGASVRNSDGAQNSLDFDHLGVAFAHGKLVAAHGPAPSGRPAERPSGRRPRCPWSAHVHDAALDRALAVQPLDLRGLSDLDVPECPHLALSFPSNRRRPQGFAPKVIPIPGAPGSGIAYTMIRMAIPLSSAMRLSLMDRIMCPQVR